MIESFDADAGVATIYCMVCHTSYGSTLSTWRMTPTEMTTDCPCGATVTMRRIAPGHMTPHALVGMVLENGNIVGEITHGQPTTDHQREQHALLRQMHEWLLARETKP